MMIGDEVLQASIISKLKNTSVITSALPAGATEIRELEWQGDTFSYPNIRVELEDNRPFYDEQVRCSLQYVEWSVYIFTEERSSKRCSQIKTILMNALIGNGFSDQTNNVRFSTVRLVENIPAVREDERTWRAQLRLSAKVTQLV